MGADIYTVKVDQVKGAIDGITSEEMNYDNPLHYFRDSYNSTNLLWRLGLSYWQDVEGLIEKHCPDFLADSDVDFEWNLPPEGVKEFYDLIRERFVSVPRGDEWEQACRWEPSDEEKAVLASIWFEKYEDLLSFLEHAIENDLYLYISY